MKATDLLKKQHKEVKVLFKSIEGARSEAKKAELFEQVLQNLVAHDAIERQILYPACEEELGSTDLLGEAVVEHGVVEFCLYEADQARGQDDFEHKCKVLSEMVEHHVKEEEKELFPKVERAFGKERLLEMGDELELRFEEIKENEDVRSLLHESLSKVLAGATKLGSSRRSAKKKSAPSSQRRVRKTTRSKRAA